MTFAETAITQPSSWAFWSGLQASESLQLRWPDILWNEGKIRVSKRWAGSDRETKTRASNGYVPLHPILAGQLQVWHQRTLYANEADFVFPSNKMGIVPMCVSIFIQDHLCPTAMPVRREFQKVTASVFRGAI